MFFGSSLFKKNSSNSPQVKKDSVINGQPAGSPSTSKNAIWDALCDGDLNSSSDLDDSMDYFYSRSNVFSNKSEIKDTKSNPHNSQTQKWKSRFFCQDSPKASPKLNKSLLNSQQKQPKSSYENPEPSLTSPQMQKFVPTSRAKFSTQPKPSGAVQRFSSFGKSPSIRSVSPVLDLHEKEYSNNCFSALKSPREPEFADAQGVISSYETNMSVVDEEPDPNSRAINSPPIPPAIQKELVPSSPDGLEKLPFLHLKLKNEAMKLENWKNNLINNLKKNEEKLVESNSLIESLRKSNLDMQMDRETASLKLKDEIENRESTDKKILGTRDLCEVIKTQIELTRSTCASTLHICLKTKTVQKSLEQLLLTTLSDFQNLQMIMDENEIKYKDIAVKHEKIVNQNQEEIKMLIKEKLSLSATLNENQLKFTSYENSTDVQINQLRQKLDQMKNNFTNCEDLLTQTCQIKNMLEDVIKETKNELVLCQLKHQEKEDELQASVSKCTQLTVDLRKIYALLNASNTASANKNQRLASLDEEVKALTETKQQLEKTLNQFKLEHELQIDTYQAEVQLLKAKCSTTLPALMEMLNDNNELLQSYEQEQRKLQERQSRYKDDLDEARANEKTLTLEIVERKRNESTKDNLIQMLRDGGQQSGKIREQLTRDLDRSSTALKELDEAYKRIDTLCNKLKEQEEKLKSEISVAKSRESLLVNELSSKKSTSIQYKETIEKLSEQIKSADEENKKVQGKTKEIGRCVDLKNDQIVKLETLLHASEEQVKQLELKTSQIGHEASQAKASARDTSTSLLAKDEELERLKVALRDAEEARMAAVKRNDEMRVELFYAVEQQQQETDKLIRQKDKEMEALQASLNHLKIETEKNSKKMDKKMSDNGSQIEKLKDQLKETNQEKKEVSKNLTTNKQRISRLEREIDEKNMLLGTYEEKLSVLDCTLEEFRTANKDRSMMVKEQEIELTKLRKIEFEFHSFKRQMLCNSPPVSTQIPREIEARITQTPKSPFLSQKLNHMNLLKTPQKTPKGILKQPGSECKRRRVMLLSPDKDPKPIIEHFVDLDADDADDDGQLVEIAPQSTNPMTPKVRRTPILDSHVSAQSRNTRKTPGSCQKGPGKNVCKTAEPSVGASWFDSDQTFGLVNED